MKCGHCDEEAISKKTAMKVCPQNHVGCAVCRLCFDRMTADAPPEPATGPDESELARQGLDRNGMRAR